MFVTLCNQTIQMVMWTNRLNCYKLLQTRSKESSVATLQMSNFSVPKIDRWTLVISTLCYLPCLHDSTVLKLYCIMISVMNHAESCPSCWDFGLICWDLESLSRQNWYVPSDFLSKLHTLISRVVDETSSRCTCWMWLVWGNWEPSAGCIWGIHIHYGKNGTSSINFEDGYLSHREGRCYWRS